MNLDKAYIILSSSNEPPVNIIEFLENCYDGLGLLSLYEGLEEEGKLFDSLPFANLYKEVKNNENAFTLFTGLIGLKALADITIQQKMLEGEVSPEVLGSISALNECFNLLGTGEIQHKSLSQEKIIEMIFNINCPLKLVPSSLLENPEFITNYCKHDWDFENGELFAEIARATSYSLKLESQLLNALNLKSLEEYLRKHLQKEKKEQENDSPEKIDSTKNIDLTQLLISKLYTLKLLNKHNTEINGFIINPYVESNVEGGKEFGEYDRIQKLISIYPFLMTTLKQVVTASSHEGYHAIQDRDVLMGDILKDPDVDIYSMDAYLIETLGKVYYDKNYTRIGTEYDAETKAEIDVAKLENDEPEYILNLMAVIGRLAHQERVVMNSLKEDPKYFYVMTRYWDYEAYDIYDLFEITINKKLKESDNYEAFVEELLSKYPIFKYSMIITPDGIFRKYPADYIEALKEASDEDIEIYLQLISNDFHPLKSSLSNMTESEYTQAMDYHSLPADLRGKVLKCMDASKNKYDKHFNSNRGVN